VGIVRGETVNSKEGKVKKRTHALPPHSLQSPKNANANFVRNSVFCLSHSNFNWLTRPGELSKREEMQY